MSADNWTTCPQCLDRARKEFDREYEAVMALYGRVPVEEFDRRRAELKQVDPDKYCTLREDYEFLNAEGEIQGDYRCSCSVCGLGSKLHVTKRFWPDESSTELKEETN